MKVCIIVFSPSGHTLHVSEKMKMFMIEKGMEVQLINVTGKKEIFRDNALKLFLKREVLPHDLICIGSPVYAGHLESNVKKIINCLPCVDSKCGKLAIPFVTYGGLHSSIALTEAGELLYRSGRKTILGMKICAFHSLSVTLNKQINGGRPNEDDDKIIFNLVDRVEKLINMGGEIKDVRKSFSYAPLIQRVALRFLSEDFFHKNYRNVFIDVDKCIGCGKCVSGCPVNRLELINNKATVTNNISHCILCAECYHNCPVNAVNFSYLTKVKNRLEKDTCFEVPESEIYPI